MDTGGTLSLHLVRFIEGKAGLEDGPASGNPKELCCNKSTQKLEEEKMLMGVFLSASAVPWSVRAVRAYRACLTLVCYFKSSSLHVELTVFHTDHYKQQHTGPNMFVQLFSCSSCKCNMFESRKTSFNSCHGLGETGSFMPKKRGFSLTFFLLTPSLSWFCFICSLARLPCCLLSAFDASENVISQTPAANDASALKVSPRRCSSNIFTVSLQIRKISSCVLAPTHRNNFSTESRSAFKWNLNIFPSAS